MMKAIFFTASLTFSTVSAQLQLDTIVDLAEQSLKLMNTTLPRNRGRNTVSARFSDIIGYGCWCHFDAEHGKGRGTAVDRFDIECMNLHHATTCMKMENCDLSVKFIPQLQLTTDGNIAYDCVIANGGDTFKEANCYTSTDFTSKILDIMLQCVHSYLSKCRELELRILNLFSKIGLFERKFHMMNIYQKKVIKSENFPK